MHADFYINGLSLVKVRTLVKKFNFCILKIKFYILHLKVQNHLTHASIKKQQSKTIPLQSVFGEESENSKSSSFSSNMN